jgi:hypothetical protein
MSIISVNLQEGFGNRCSQYAFARAYSEKHGCTLQTNFWMGQKVFQIDDPRIEKPLPVRRMEDIDRWNGEVDIEVSGWGQHQRCLIYSRADARRYFTFRPEIISMLVNVPKYDIAAHLRWADFLSIPDAGFIAISKESYLIACDHFGIDRSKLRFIQEESPLVVPQIEPGYWISPHSDHHTRSDDPRITSLGFLPDFYALMQADILFRANSTFSLWAAILGHHSRIFSPNLNGIKKRSGFQEVPFFEGNHCAITSDANYHTELNLRET